MKCNTLLTAACGGLVANGAPSAGEGRPALFGLRGGGRGGWGSFLPLGASSRWLRAAQEPRCLPRQAVYAPPRLAVTPPAFRPPLAPSSPRRAADGTGPGPPRSRTRVPGTRRARPRPAHVVRGPGAAARAARGGRLRGAGAQARRDPAAG